MTVVGIPLDGGGVLNVEALPGDQPSGPVRAGGGATQLVQQAGDTLREVLGPVCQAAETVLEELRRAAPDELQVEFGVALTASAGAVTAKAESQCHLKVTMTWKAPDGNTP